MCFEDNEVSFLRRFDSYDSLCFSCRKTLRKDKRWIQLDRYRVYGLYLYEGDVRHLLLRYKEHYDQLLAPVFLYEFRMNAYLFYANYSIVCVPSNRNSTRLRGFNTVGDIAHSLNMPIIEGVLMNLAQEKQGLKSFESRLLVGKDLKAENLHLIKGKKIILLDDILTTGSTMKACFDLLSPHCEKIVGLCVAYHQNHIALSCKTNIIEV